MFAAFEMSSCSVFFDDCTLGGDDLVDPSLGKSDVVQAAFFVVLEQPNPVGDGPTLSLCFLDDVLELSD